MKRSSSLVITLALVFIWISPAYAAYASDSGSGTLPAIFPDGGYYLGAPSVTITSVSGAIYYTTDGSNPANSNTATAYSGPFPVNRSQLLLAAAHGSSGWSNVASAMFNVGGPAPQQPVVATPPAPASPLELTALYNKRGQTVVSVVYNGTLDQDTWYTVTISDQATWNEVASGKISADNTGAVIGPVEEDHNYQLSIKQQGRVNKYYGAFSVQKKSDAVLCDRQ
jgi:hypothetical protein